MMMQINAAVHISIKSLILMLRFIMTGCLLKIVPKFFRETVRVNQKKIANECGLESFLFVSLMLLTA